MLAGAPNAGKSSLLNRLAEQEAAIVTDIAGTTRDVLREHIQIGGLPLHIVDTAGLRQAGDKIEQEGIRRARAEMASADRILLVIDDSADDRRPSRESLLEQYAEDLPKGVMFLQGWFSMTGIDLVIDDSDRYTLWQVLSVLL